MITLSHYPFKSTLKHQAAKVEIVVLYLTAEDTYKNCCKCEALIKNEEPTNVEFALLGLYYT